jgi:lysophospholipase L1-like esterase
MPSYPVNSRKMASVARRPARVNAVRNVGRRLLRTAIGPLLRPVQTARQTQLALLPVPSGRVLMLGDSITEGGVWHELLPDVPLVNRGVGGETGAQILQRLDLVINDPTAVVLLAGTNDIASGIPTAKIVADIAQILTGIERRAPRTPVIVQSIMPRALAYREEVLFMNARVRELVERAGAHVRYLDLWPALADAEGALRAEYTEDKLHLNGDGYAAWVSVLGPALESVLPTRRRKR